MREKQRYEDGMRFFCLFLVILFIAVGNMMIKRSLLLARAETGTKDVLEEKYGIPTRVDYSDSNNWLSCPKYPQKDVDIFFAYPTAWGGAEGEILCSIDNEIMRNTAVEHLETKASAFEPVGNIYMPFYRQLDAGFILRKDPDIELAYIRTVPGTDMEDAFDYYMEHYNNGRPYILAGHSQGSMVLRELLVDYMPKHPKSYERMIAAYLIGFSITEEDLEKYPHLKYAEGPDDTGVIISYNTEAPRVDGKNTTLLDRAVTINPITWTRTDEWAPAALSKGSRMKVDGEYQDFAHFADARVNLKRGTVICSNIDRDEYFSHKPDIFPRGVYHYWDFDLYYYDLRENAKDRAEHWLNTHKNN